MYIKELNATDISIENTSKISKNNQQSNFSNTLDNTYTFKDIFYEASRKYNISIDLLQAVAMTESSFNPDCVSHAGAMGLMQLMPKTAEYLGVSNAFDPYQNVMGGAKYLSELLQKYNGNTNLALAAYNGGMGNVAKYNGIPPFCEKYVNKVNNYLNQKIQAPDKVFLIDNQTKNDISKTNLTETNKTNTITVEKNNNSQEDNISTNLSSEEFAKMVYNLYSKESSKTATNQLDLLKSLLNDSFEYTQAITLMDSINSKKKENI